MGLAQEAAASAPAAEGGDTFTKPDISSAIPPELKDTVDRVVAAGMKMMYSPAMRDEMRTALNSKDPTPKVLADNVVGLLLTLDSKAPKGGIPSPALMPAAVELLGDAADVMVKAGRPVSQEDFKTAMQMAFVIITQKLGGSGAQTMDIANKALPPEEQVAGGAPPDGTAADAVADSASAAAPVDPAAAAGPTPAAAPPAGGPPLAEQAAVPPPEEEVQP